MYDFGLTNQTLSDHLALLHTGEGICIEPSATAGCSGPLHLRTLALACAGANHVVWTTNGLALHIPQPRARPFDVD